MRKKLFFIIFTGIVSNSLLASIPENASLTESEACMYENKTYSTFNIIPSYTSASDYIQTSGLVYLSSSRDVTFSAGNRITLNQGFICNYGAHFIAKIGPCVPQIVVPGNQPNTFSPNGDDVNDDLLYLNIENVDRFDVRVYNSCDVIIYEYQNGVLDYLNRAFIWDGTGTECNYDHYRVIATFYNDASGETKVFDQDVAITGLNNCNINPLCANVFTPNGDGINDYYCCNYEYADYFEITVFDRYGNEFFSSSGETDGIFVEDNLYYDCFWDGAGTVHAVYYVHMKLWNCYGKSWEDIINVTVFLALTKSTAEITELNDIETTENFIVFPNPVNQNNLKVINPFDGEWNLQIIGINGNVVLDKEAVNKGIHEIDVTGIPSGNYLLKLYNGNQIFITKIIINSTD